MSRRAPTEQEIRWRKQLGRRLREARTEEDLSQRALSALSGVHYVSICHYENGIVTPRSWAVYRIAQALNLEASWLLGLDQ